MSSFLHEEGGKGGFWGGLQYNRTFIQAIRKRKKKEKRERKKIFHAWKCQNTHFMCLLISFVREKKGKEREDGWIEEGGRGGGFD